MNIFTTYNAQKLKIYSIMMQLKINASNTMKIFSQNKQYIYVFKKIIWYLPHRSASSSMAVFAIIFRVDTDNPSCFTNEMLLSCLIKHANSNKTAVHKAHTVLRYFSPRQLFRYALHIRDTHSVKRCFIYIMLTFFPPDLLKMESMKRCR
jgi:hypothetical protein